MCPTCSGAAVPRYALVNANRYGYYRTTYSAQVWGAARGHLPWNEHSCSAAWLSHFLIPYYRLLSLPVPPTAISLLPSLQESDVGDKISR